MCNLTQHETSLPPHRSENSPVESPARTARVAGKVAGTPPPSWARWAPKAWRGAMRNSHKGQAIPSRDALFKPSRWICLPILYKVSKWNWIFVNHAIAYVLRSSWEKPTVPWLFWYLIDAPARTVHHIGLRTTLMSKSYAALRQGEHLLPPVEVGSSPVISHLINLRHLNHFFSPIHWRTAKNLPKCGARWHCVALAGDDLCYSGLQEVRVRWLSVTLLMISRLVSLLYWSNLKLLI